MEPKKDKVSRSLKLESDINDRLVAVCRHLGVNPNAYLINEIGKAISRDEVAFVVANNSKNSMNDMVGLLQNLLADNK
ncbi:hypothetical protein [Shewanella frigidimarina]|uniref:hypothetical protein n=1 Tax=Shewanella frigidimarina TaxID=56812 RepID=UPI003D7B5295